MSDDVQQELVDVIAEALWEDGIARSDIVAHEVAGTVLAALTARYGEPAIELFVKQEVIDNNWKNTPLRRLVFPWQPVEGDQG